SEAVPFAKTGGLADVAGALPAALKALGHKVTIFMPHYTQFFSKYMAKAGEFKPERKVVIEKFKVPISNKEVNASLISYKLKENGLEYYCIDIPKFYDRTDLYGTTEEGDYKDNSERFIGFSRAVLEALKVLNDKPDVIHANDWQSGMIPVYLKSLYSDHPLFKNTVSVFSIHNIAYQGVFWHYDMHITGLDWDYFTFDKLEFYGKINLLKGGIVFSDFVNTVSKRYAEEIQTSEFGYGLEGVLTAKRKDLDGIVNGIDYDIWNPETDKILKKNFTPSNPVGKDVCKEDLQEIFGVKVDKSKYLIGCVSRLADQKGFDLIADIFEEMINLDLQFVLLGTGDKKYHELFEKLNKKYPGKFGLKLAYNNDIAHKIYAGSDSFLMPSRYEPCGLGQLIAMKYGTVPVVRETGGLADTVTPVNIGTKKGTGFRFKEYTGDALFKTIKESYNFYNKKEDWKELVMNCFNENFSWEQSAKTYIDFYQKYMKLKNL
ncbi:MAG TPA: glycogen synthase GlgA, partial [Firmicutes bacterium]|nr:glycogen synthase GlgA [Bacillota bacterium]